MGQYLIDNNAISNYFSELLPESAMSLISTVIDQTPNISVITEIEALSWLNPDKNKEAIVQAFIQDANVLGLTSDVINQCVKIRRTRKIKTPDAIIAAIVHKLVLITSDSGFSNIEGLQLFDPKQA